MEDNGADIGKWVGGLQLPLARHSASGKGRIRMARQLAQAC
jgi:hypothetical protein